MLSRLLYVSVVPSIISSPQICSFTYKSLQFFLISITLLQLKLEFSLIFLLVPIKDCTSSNNMESRFQKGISKINPLVARVIVVCFKTWPEGGSVLFAICHFRDGLSLVSHFTCMRMKIVQVLFAKCLQELAEFSKLLEVFVQITFHG